MRSRASKDRRARSGRHSRRSRRALPSAGDGRLQAFLAEITAERAKARLKIVERSGELRLLHADEVFCLEADEDYVKVHTGKETVTWRTTLAHASESLDPGVFLRVHRSYIVNTGRVRKVTRIGKGEYFFELENGRKVGTGRTYREAVEAFINR